jgi:hypothetical protein
LNAHVIAGRWQSDDMITGFFVTERASAWNHIMKPQSPVIACSPPRRGGAASQTQRGERAVRASVVSDSSRATTKGVKP